MDPLQHITTLKEMGIDWYVPRSILAADSASIERITIIREAKPQVQIESESLVSKHVTNSLVKKPKLNIDFGLDTVKRSSTLEQAAASKPAPRIVAEKIASFNLLVASSGSLIFVTDVKTNPLSAVWERSVRQFFDEIDFACGAASKKVQAFDYFSWPIIGNTNMNLGEDELIQFLTGFMRQHITETKKGVVLFGDNAKQYGASVVSSINDLHVIAAPSLGVMFTNFSAKAALWSNLQILTKGSD
jgi:hypothetical protein